MASATSQKRKAIDLESKYNALKDVDRGGRTKHSIAAKYGVKALSNWISNRKAIEEAYLGSWILKKSHLRWSQLSVRSRGGR